MVAYPYYNTYNPYQQSYYQPMMQQAQIPVQNQQMAQQPVQQAQQQTTAQPTYNTGRIWVNGKSEVDFFPVVPNSAVDLWDRNGTVLYQKKADATGRPSVTVFDVVERTDAPFDGGSEQSANNTAYATKDDLGAVVGVVKGFDDVLTGLRQDIETMKGDMYGLTGRKKTKKSEDTAE